MMISQKMFANKSRHKKFVNLITNLIPFAVCAIVAIIITVLNKNSNFIDFLYRVLDLSCGVVAHEIAWALGLYVFKWKMAPTIKGTLRFSLLGYLFTLLYAVLSSDSISLELIYLVKVSFRVAVICFLVQVFLFQFGFYKKLHKQRNKSEEENHQYNVESLLTLKSNEKIERISIAVVSHIYVQDHYCTIVYQKDNQWEQSTVYEKLKNYESQFDSHLIKINRSTLVNPEMVQKIEKKEGKFNISMKGSEDATFVLSNSLKHLVDDLVPVVS